MYLNELMEVVNNDTTIAIVDSDSQIKIAELDGPYDLCNVYLDECTEVMDIVAENGRLIVDVDCCGHKIFEEMVEPEWYFEFNNFEDNYPLISFLNDRDYPHTDMFNDVRTFVESEILFELKEGWWKTGTEFFENYLPKDEPWTRDEVKQAIYYAENLNDYNAIVAIMGLMDGHNYEICTIRGCLQRDWAEIVYPTDVYDRTDISRLEDLFFDLATEWKNLTDDVCGYYTTSWHDEDIKEELARQEGIEPYQVTLRKITDRQYYQSCKCTYETV